LVNVKHLKGQIGVHLVLIELNKRGIDALRTKTFWGFDVFTMNGIKIEVKLSNIGIGKGGTGSSCERFTFRVSSAELELLDFLVLVLNTKEGYLFYIIPKSVIDGRTIAFNPFSSQKSKYEKYLNRWDLIEKAHNLRHNMEKFKDFSEKERSYYQFLNESSVKKP
jgi:hypothetical protein